MPKFSVERSIQINAPRGQVYATVRDFRAWPKWSPWLISEPDCQLEFAADGRSYTWTGKYIGAGSMAVTEEQEGVAIDYALNFLRPFKSASAVRFAFANAGDATKVTWTMHGSLPFFLFWLTKTMTGIIGMDYDRGLGMLKRVIETGDRGCALEILGRQSFEGFPYVGIRRQCAVAEIGPAMERDFAALLDHTEAADFSPAGAPFSIYHQWDFGRGEVDYTIGIPVDHAVASPPDGVISGALPDCEVYAIQHTGPYELLGNPWSAGYSRQQAKEFQSDKKLPPFEIYQNDPKDTPEEDLVTLVHFPVKPG